ncbi:sister chromatid cohesion C-terminus-domain-containing protein [Mycotypha africana]|uniref:sister chromatid cohesion C-terminus-domain-containing protein n=1 Tax=Mycotypha africana TaxID=64632 RepID=UPI002300A23F|nr:sister chromatid cohesion C-terminus-domain-containing protein [Mycotypha africana]KAI8991309.1 sister chromatid cohesion C-terminus-domain-containing protein [Mycotypha africana]
MSLLEENTNDHFLKSIAIEWLGNIACRIKTDYNRLSGTAGAYGPEWICSMHETLPMNLGMETPTSSIALIDQCRKKLLDYIIQENTSESIAQYYLCNWGFMESVLWLKANKGWEAEDERLPTVKAKDQTAPIVNEENTEDNIANEAAITDTTVNQRSENEDILTVEPDSTDNGMIEEDSKWPKEAVLLLEDTCKYYWLKCLNIDCQAFPPSKFCIPNHDSILTEATSREDYNLLCVLLASRQTLYTSLHYIIAELLTCLEKDGVVYRTKSLKAFEKLAIQVPEIMNDTRIRTAILHRVHDNSPSVRDAALKVVARFLVQLNYDQENVKLLHKLYNVVSGRIIDTAVPVRKRLVKLLADLYPKFSDLNIKTDIASKLILRMSDKEVLVNQLALKATQKILFEPFKEMDKGQGANDYFGYSYANSPKSRKHKITQLTSIITGAVSKLNSTFIGQNIALTQIIQKTLDGADDKDKLWYDKVFQWIVDCLFDGLIKFEEEDNSEEFINCLATADWVKAHYTLTIYRDVLPNMKYHDPSFIHSVERLLMQLLGRCPLNLIPDGVSCLCTIVDSLSHRYDILIKMLGSCITKLSGLRELIRSGRESDINSYAGVLKMLLICGLLCQHFEFDKRREQNPEDMKSLDSIYKGSINLLVFDILQFFTSEEMYNLEAVSVTERESSNKGMTLRMTALQGLGYLFASYPTFMISQASIKLMDNILSLSNEESAAVEMKIQLMHVYQEFLAAEEKRLGKKEILAGEALAIKSKSLIDVDTLLGNTEEYAELGVNGSLMQRYLKKILQCTLSNESEQLRYAAFEVVSSIIEQGLAHPVLCMQVIVAAETSMDMTLRMKAYYLHKYAHDKYGQLLYVQLNECFSTSYAYQKISSGDNVKGSYSRGRGGDAKVESVLGLTYSVLKEKKKSKLDFLCGLIKPFEYDMKTASADDIDIGYLQYLAENAISLDLGSTDEVLHMVHIMDRIFFTTGADLSSYIQYLKKKGVLSNASLENEVVTNNESTSTALDDDITVTFKLAIAMCILLYTKNLLVELYDIPDE